MDEVLHIVVEGDVQGVGFRFYTEAMARRIGVAGWVRNLPGGAVEILARVSRRDKGRFLTEIEKGPPMSVVARVRVQPAADPGACPAQGFTIRT